MTNKPARILYVEDEPSFASVVCFVLKERHGHEVDLAETGETGIEKLKASQYDLVFLDYLLPGVSGLDVLRWMKDSHVDTPVIMLTAAGSENIAVEAMKLGAYDYIRKEQLELDHLPVLIYNSLEQSILRKENNRMEAELRERDDAVKKMFQDTVRTLAHYINNTLATLMLRAQVFQRKLEREFHPDEREKVRTLLQAVLQDARTIEGVMKALMSVSNVVYQKYAGDQEIIDIRSELERVLQDTR